MDLQVLNQFLLLLEDVLELTQGGLHLLKGELVLSLSCLILGNPSIELSDGVIKQLPLLNQGINLFDPIIRHSLNFVVSSFQGSNLIISLLVGSHLLGSTVGSFKNLEVVQARLLKTMDLLSKGSCFRQVGWLRKTLSRGLLGLCQPRCEFLDTCSVFSPELDIF